MSIQMRFCTCPEPGQLTCAAQVDWGRSKRRMRYFYALPRSLALLARSGGQIQFSGCPHRIFSIFWVSQAPPRGKLLRWLDRKFYCQFSHRRGAKKKVLELDREFSVGDGSKEIRWGLHGRSSLAGVLDYRLVRRVTVSLQVARVAIRIQNHCSGRSIWVIWRGIEPRFLDCRVDGDDSRPLQNGVIFRPFDVTASFTPAVYGCGCGLPLCQKLEGIEYDVREPMMSEIR